MFKTLPNDGWHKVGDEYPEQETEVYIECIECGGTAILGYDGRWYWTFHGCVDEPCRSGVIRWHYLGQKEV